ncbi:helix-turn-helix domain-containing protein [Roseovarius sp. EL26]|uniref:helix-turn-helix domain-containing protein n=1 Tax=Roseovarius sp. EL26 TaxID=2126672 RepID=UPI000EA21DA6|nr:helix-turn-helix transcriptional regulator [Roseovarius sp. EL26]
MTKSLRSEGHIALIRALVEARKAKGISQAELATLLKCHQSFVARIESGQRRIDVPELVILSRALDADASVLLTKVSSAVPLGARI